MKQGTGNRFLTAVAGALFVYFNENKRFALPIVYAKINLYDARLFNRANKGAANKPWCLPV